MDYSSEYWVKNPTYHKEDSPRKSLEILSLVNYKPKTVIDIGCGGGYLSELLYKKLAPEYMVGVDISKDAIETATTNGSGKVKYIVDDIRDSKVKGHFELGIVADLIEHLEDDSGFITDVMTICDKCIIRVPCEKNLYNDFLLKFGLSNEYSSLEERYGHIHHYSIKDLIELFQKCNIKVEQYKFFYLGKRSRAINNLAVLLSKIVGIFSRELAVKLFGGFVVLRLSK